VVGPRAALSAAGEARVAEHLQPVRVSLAGQDLGGGLPHTLGAIAALRPPMVQVELQPDQIDFARAPLRQSGRARWADEKLVLAVVL
jgi:hypothetical protein